MIRFLIHGLTLTLVDQNKTTATALMVNSETSQFGLKTHLRSLFVQQSALDTKNTTFIAPLPSIDGRWGRGGVSDDTGWVGWDLSGLRLTVPHSANGIKLDDTYVKDPNPDPNSGDDTKWDPLKWVITSDQLLKGKKKLRSDWRDLSKHIISTTMFLGGTVHGGPPFAEGGKWLWSVDGVGEQAITDCLTLEVSPAAGESLRIQVRDGSRSAKDLGVIAIADSAKVYLINEAPLSRARRDKAAVAPKPNMPDLKAYFEAFEITDTEIGEIKIPYATTQFDFKPPVNRFDTDYCIGGLVLE